jgi:[acyl-carrier-protein] S-malonyltransferase
MGKTAFVFPGQGAAAVGMGQNIIAASPEAAAVWAEAVAALSDLAELCAEGPLDRLIATSNAQPAIFAVDCACLAALRAAGAEPDIVAGHSLGEYAALVAAGALAFSEALALVRARGEAMEAACARPSTMMAITGLEAGEVEAIVEDWDGDGVLAVANYNCPGQTVVGGDVATVRAAATRFTAAGGRVIELAVGGAFHSPLMAPAEAIFLPVLDRTEFREPLLPVVSNTTGRVATTAAQALDALRPQITASVKWEQSVETMLDEGVDTFVEAGPGKTLIGLVRRVAAKREARPRLLNVEDGSSLAKSLAALRAD